MNPVTGPIVQVDTAALEALARELAGLSDRLIGEGTTPEWQPAVPQPTGQATVDLTAAANHVVGECAANLLLFADQIASAARFYQHVDSEEAHYITTSVQPPG
jgi:hypothetical protein